MKAKNKTIRKMIFKTVFILLFCLFFYNILIVTEKESCFLYAKKQSAEEAAKEVSNKLLSDWFSSKHSVDQKVIHPFTMNNTPLYTLDRSKSGNVRISCPSSKNAIIVSISLLSTKDLSHIEVKYDLNLNGNFERNEILYIEGPISGVCANGFVKCKKGTWENCKWYMWIVENGLLSYKEVLPNRLGGCYCINSSCTSNEFLNYKNQVLNNLGGGIVGVITKVYPRLKITHGKIDSYTIKYAAQDEKKCQSITTNQTVAITSQKPESFKKNPNQIIIEGRDLYQQQTSDPESLTSLIFNSQTSHYASQNKCIMARDYSPTSVYGCFTVRFGRRTVEVFGSGTSIIYRIWKAGVRGTPQAHYLAIPTQCKKYSIASNITLTACPVSDGLEITVASGSSKKTATLTMTGQESETSTCINLENDPNCRLKEEKTFDVEGNWIYTYRHFNPINIDPLPTCKYGKCYEWWQKERIYICKSEEGVEVDMTRVQHVSSTLKETSTGLAYQDKILKNDQWQIVNEETKLNQKDYEVECVASCKIRKWIAPAQGAQGYTSKTYNKAGGHYELIYRICNENNECPYDPSKGEELIETCKCINEFNKAITMMEVLRLSAIDVICSSK